MGFNSRDCPVSRLDPFSTPFFFEMHKKVGMGFCNAPYELVGGTVI